MGTTPSLPQLIRELAFLKAIEFISIYDILCLQRKEATAMGHLRFTDLQTRPIEVLDLTSLTLDEFRRLGPPFEAAFQAHMTQWCFDGQPRTARRYTTYQHCAQPTPEDRLWCILTYLKISPLQVVQGRLFGMDQSKANQLDSPPARGAAGHAVGPGGCPQPVLAGAGPADRGDRG
jgi:hypothetical protein